MVSSQDDCDEIADVIVSRDNPGVSPEPSRRALATLAWTRMHNLVQGNNRDDQLRDELDLGRGSGRVRTLLGLSQGSLSLGALAETTRADPPYVTLIVNELQARGLVTRTSDPEDRRRKLVALTEAGQEAVRTAKSILYRPPHSFLAALSKAELQQLGELLDRLE